jgi:uncharacterized membrane protein YkvA (DUF1232 family)
MGDEFVRHPALYQNDGIRITEKPSAKKYLSVKPKPKTTEPLMTSSKPSTTQFGQLSPDAWRISGKTMTIDEYIENQRQEVRSTDLRVLGTFTDRLLDKLKETNASEYPGLTEAVHTVVRLLESPAARLAKDPLPPSLAEIGFAAGYLLKRFDLIPDHVAEIGLADDAIILQRVIERNQSELFRSLRETNDLTAGDS